jgi:hypothetical protein
MIEDLLDLSRRDRPAAFVAMTAIDVYQLAGVLVANLAAGGGG